ncbi:hypothetical protein VC83_04568 [Pseudogymnoascus destructans]|uniref:Uncharacterized protein n=1 Tax=Pseudogymnoascus destructans TaxID=655981 RepID=A0A177A849_9PEZI|nr:uncharacterized protein VC83_04568 [Pseudogymnoascus destructans]OAF57303.1 hypothetical protein VC83_04568 [Pseudogymnoascus destructans]
MEPIPPNIKFAPAVPFPDPFVPENRIKQLRQYLDEKNDSYQLAGQQANIATIVPEDEAYKRHGHVWIEQGIAYQMSAKCAYGNGTFGPKRHE